ncbi:hypothetical protein B0J15DRAFT_153894 [Fusarium solani]|uniref:Uncharacterized protein n=1 Tax=Fusarium solani TaxID=169388 RepID=A0A9P9JR25_FUSSL|nr:uncharacterized protein B0J15DRAFT_153894 [Fusarium solani]KAH7234597.1 hypothetical protein B0J15DRAFT_153894 [Fusarium solani]
MRLRVLACFLFLAKLNFSVSVIPLRSSPALDTLLTHFMKPSCREVLKPSIVENGSSCPGLDILNRLVLHIDPDA